MAWDDPASVSTGDLITAATWNQDVVDNVQYVHDNRIVYIPIFYAEQDATSSESYVTPKFYSHYLGSSIDEADLDTAHFSTMVFTNNGSHTAYAQLYDVSGAAAVTGSEVSTTSTSDVNTEISGDIKANLPTTDVSIAVQQKIADAAAACAIKNGHLILAF